MKLNGHGLDIGFKFVIGKMEWHQQLAELVKWDGKKIVDFLLRVHRILCGKHSNKVTWVRRRILNVYPFTHIKYCALPHAYNVHALSQPLAFVLRTKSNIVLRFCKQTFVLVVFPLNVESHLKQTVWRMISANICGKWLVTWLQATVNRQL